MGLPHLELAFDEMYRGLGGLELFCTYCTYCLSPQHQADGQRAFHFEAAHLGPPYRECIAEGCRPHNLLRLLLGRMPAALPISPHRHCRSGPPSSTGERPFSFPPTATAELDPSCRLPAACDLYRLGISLGGVSKTLGLPGLRLGWLASRAELTQHSQHKAEAGGAAGLAGGSSSGCGTADGGTVSNGGTVAVLLQRRIRELKDYTTICSSAPSEVGLGRSGGGREGGEMHCTLKHRHLPDER